MPAILIRILTWLMTSIAGQVLFSLGLGITSFAMFNSLFNWIEYMIAQNFGGTATNWLIAMHLIEADFYFSVLLSAFSIKTAMLSASVALRRT